MATKGSKSSKVRSVSLADEDRRFLDESLQGAKGKTGVGVDEGSVFEALERFGLSSERVQRLRAALSNVDVREGVDKASEYLAEQIESAREYARSNPKKVIGGAAGVLVGASLLALAIRRAAGDDRKKSSSAKKSSGSKKAAAPAKSSGGSKKSSAKKRSR